MSYVQKIKIIYALREIVADVKSLDAAISYIKKHWSNYSGEWIDINDPHVESEIRKIYQDIVKNPIYRAIRLDNPSEFDKNDLGIYWTYIKDKAKAYWGGGRYLILITAKVTENDIDWIGTVECQLRAKTAGEEEVRLKENAKPKIIKIEQQAISKANSMNFIKKLEKAYTKIEAGQISRYYHGSPTDHGDILKVLGLWDTGMNTGHDFGGVFLSKEDKWGHIGPSENVWYYVNLKDSEILQLKDLHHHSPEEPNIKKVLELFDLVEEESDDLEFIWDVICGSSDRNEYDRLQNIVALGEHPDWQIQTIQGQIAEALGFKAVELKDERGTAYLLVGPNEMQKDLNQDDE